MKTLWILNHYAQPPEGVGSTRHHSIASYLQEYNWNVTIIAASSEHNTGKQRAESKTFSATSNKSGVNWLWLKCPAYRGNGIKRILNMVSYMCLALVPRITKKLPKPDVVLGSSVHPLAGVAGFLLAKRHGVPFVFEVRDLWPASLIDMGKLKSTGVLAKLLYKLETFLVEKSSLVITVLPRSKEYFYNISPGKRVVVFPNGFSPNAVPAFVNETNYEEFLFVYCGALGEANSVDTLLEALALMEKNAPDHRFLCRIIGDGAQKDVLMKKSVDLGLRSIRFENTVSKNEVPRVLSEANAAVIMVRDLPDLYRFGISMNKVFDYMAAGRAIVMSADVPANPVKLANGGIVVPPENSVLLSKAMLKVMQLPEQERKLLGRSAYEYAYENHNYRKMAKSLNSVLRVHVL